MTDRKQLRRDEILDAAELVFARQGYHETGIADIAAELGIGHGTFYRYFKNKHEVATTVVQRAIARVAEAGLAEDPEASNSLAEYREQVDRLLSGMLDLLFENPQVMQVFHQQSAVIDSDALADAFDSYAKFTERFLRNGLNKGFLRPGLDVEITAQALVAIIFEATRRALRESSTVVETRRWAEAGVALMFDGIAAPTES